MKDIVANRRKIDLPGKLRLARLVLRENGPLWTMHFAAYYLASTIADRAHARMHGLRVERHLPGLNSFALNREIWQSWNWESGGEEFTPSEAWKASLIDHVLMKYMVPGGRILEIGPGAGRWTGVLATIAGHLIGVDISPACVEICRRKFASHANAEFHVNDGSAALPFIESGSIDAIWSFDVFVHINALETGAYLREFRRVLKPGGRAVIHHGATGGRTGGWRSDVTAEVFRELVEANGLTTLAELDRWRAGDQDFEVSCYGDLVTIVEQTDASDPSGAAVREGSEG
jgi:SAM-dependent methyltransferase